MMFNWVNRAKLKSRRDEFVTTNHAFVEATDALIGTKGMFEHILRVASSNVVVNVALQ